jgi:hypothetical protein
MTNKKKNRNLKLLSDFAKSYASSEKSKGSVKRNLLKSKDGIRTLSSSSCIRPDIFLNNDRTCDCCMYSEDCVSRVKKFSKYYKK